MALKISIIMAAVDKPKLVSLPVAVVNPGKKYVQYCTTACTSVGVNAIQDSHIIQLNIKLVSVPWDNRGVLVLDPVTGIRVQISAKVKAIIITPTPPISQEIIDAGPARDEA